LAGQVLAKIEQVVGTDRRSMHYAAFLHRKGCYYWTFFRSSFQAVRLWQKARDAYIRLSGLTSFEVVVLTGRITFIWYLRGKFDDASTLLSGYFFDLPPLAFASVPFRFNWVRSAESSSTVFSGGDNFHVAMLFDFAQKLVLHVPATHALRLSDGCLRAIDRSHCAFEVVTVFHVDVLRMVGGQDASPQQQFEHYRRLLPHLKNTESILVVLGELGGVCCDLGRYEDSLNYYHMALDVERETPSAVLRAGLLLFNMSFVFQKLRWYCKGLACCEECLELCGTLDRVPSYFVTLVQMRNAFHARCQLRFVCRICRTKSKWGCRDCPAMVECCSKFHCSTHECDRCCGAVDIADVVEMLEEIVEVEEDAENVDICMQLDAMTL
jgi:hypothetical protein